MELLLPLLLLGLLIATCIQLLLPFVGLLLWTVILAVCFYPLHKKLVRKGISNRLSAILIGAGLVALILIPTAIAAISAASSAPAFVEGLKTGKQQIPAPPAALLDVPVVGAKAHGVWAQAYENMPAFSRSLPRNWRRSRAGC